MFMLKDIMVHLDQTPSCKNRLDAAINLAKRHGASLTGLYVYSSPRMNQPLQKSAEISEMFLQKMEGTDVASDWLEVDLGFSHVGVAEMIGYYTSFTDLLVVSQPLTAERNKQHSVITSPERLLVGSGRPVLIIPASGVFPRIGERVMVAWKAGPKASRAMHDVMPLLQTAQHVSVVSVDKRTYSPDEGKRLSRYLELHNINADIELIPPGDLSVGDTLLNLVADDKIDLMVLGVHISTRRGHLDMGDVGSYLLGQMTVPMILSH
jgi:nucleotide-binding universal stress UspA family protein